MLGSLDLDCSIEQRACECGLGRRKDKKEGGREERLREAEERKRLSKKGALGCTITILKAVTHKHTTVITEILLTSCGCEDNGSTRFVYKEKIRDNFQLAVRGYSNGLQSIT